MGATATVAPTAPISFTGSNITVGRWHFKATLTLRASGGTGTLTGDGIWEGFGIGKGSTFVPGIPGTTTIDTTTTNAVDLLLAFGTANPSNAITCDQLVLRFTPAP